MIKECQQCGSEFKPNINVQKYCSKECQKESRYKNKKCEACGSVFRSKHPNVRFCSPKCSARTTIKPDLVHGLMCVNCNKEFSRPRSRVRATKIGHFCSRTCWDDYNSKMKSEKSHKWRSKKVECENCGESFTRQNNQLINREKTFCCHLCYSHWMSENQTGESSPSWRGGWSSNRGNYWDVISEKIRERDGYHCQDCKVPQKDEKLHVHHIIPFRFFDTPERANKESNLISLCKNCHFKQKSHWWKEVPEEYNQYM